MNVCVQIISGPLPRPASSAAPGTGALLCFDGIVRPMEDSRPIVALDYEVYSPMAERSLELLAGEMMGKHELLAISVWHSSGRVEVGEVSFRLEVCAAHRKPAIAAMDEFIDRMKQDVPIWKRAVFAEEVSA